MINKYPYEVKRVPIFYRFVPMFSQRGYFFETPGISKLCDIDYVDSSSVQTSLLDIYDKRLSALVICMV